MAINDFIPAIWSRLLLENLRNSLVFGQPAVINQDYTGEIAGAGSSVKIHSIGAITVDDYTKNSDLSAPETLTDDEVILNIDQARAFNFQIDDVDAAQQVPKVMQGAMAEAAYALANDLDSYLAGLNGDADITSGFGTDNDPIEPDTDSAYEYLANAFTALDEANCPSQGRWAVVPPWFHGLLRKDARFVSYGTDQNRAVLENGIVGQAAGFNVFVSNNVANDEGAAYKIMFGHPAAWTMALQVEKVEAFRMERRFADAMKGLNVYGAKVVRPTILGCMTADRTGDVIGS
jgi:N4-gp56 family major capsid protein